MLLTKEQEHTYFDGTRKKEKIMTKMINNMHAVTTNSTFKWPDKILDN